MTKKQFIDNLISELSYRVPEGMPILSNPRHIQVMSEILDEWGLYSIKNEIINALSEAPEAENNDDDDSQYETPVLNKEIEYENSKGETETGSVGDLLRTPEGTDSRQQAEKHVPEKGTPERDKIDDDLGDEGKPSDGETKDGDATKNKSDGEETTNNSEEGEESEPEKEQGSSIKKDKDTLSRYEKEKKAAKEDTEQNEGVEGESESSD